MSNNDDKPNLSTCPICGYTDSSTDPEMLEMDLREHIKSAHNLDPDNVLTPGAIKPDTGAIYDTNADLPPIAAPVANIGTSASAVMAAPNLDQEDHSGNPDTDTERHEPVDTSIRR